MDCRGRSRRKRWPSWSPRGANWWTSVRGSSPWPTSGGARTTSRRSRPASAGMACPSRTAARRWATRSIRSPRRRLPPSRSPCTPEAPRPCPSASSRPSPGARCWGCSRCSRWPPRSTSRSVAGDGPPPMKAQFTFISGARAGQTDVFSQAHISIGRHPQSELRFDADQDLDVSSRHASVTLVGEFYVLRDLGSTNGTFVNGKKLTGDHMLATRDVIRFGPSGPQVEFTAIGAPGPGVAAAAAKPEGTVVFGQQPAAPPPPPPPQLSPEQMRSPRRTPGPGTQTKVRMEVRRQTKGLRTTTIGLFALLVVLAGAYLWQVRAADQALADQRRALLGQVDSLMQEIGAIVQGNEGLRAALDSSQAEAGRLRQMLANAPDEERMAELRTRLEQALRQQRSLAGAASVDARGIAAANRDASALVFVEFPDGR